MLQIKFYISYFLVIWKSIHIRQTPKPSIEVNMTISSVYDEYSQSFHLFTKPHVLMLLSPDQPCTEKHVVMIPSAPRNINMRYMLRKQLGHKVFLLFLLGRTGSEDGDRMLEEESRIEKDILQGDFRDSYRILPYKVIMGYIWVNR